MKLTSMPVVVRLNLILAVAFLGVIALAAVALSGFRAQMQHDAQRAVRSLVESAHATVAHFHRLEQSGEVTREAAQAAAREALRAVRYDGDEHLWITDLIPAMVMHPLRTELEGRDMSEVRDPAGKYLFREFVAAAGSGGGFVEYLEPWGSAAEPRSRLAYVKAFEPWGWIVGAAAPVGYIEIAVMNNLYRYAAVVVGAMTVLGLVTWRVARSLTGQLGGEPAYAQEIIRRVSQGELQVDVEVKGDNRHSVLAGLAGMLAQLRAMMGEIGGDAERTASSPHEAAPQLAGPGRGQADAASAVATALERRPVSIGKIGDTPPVAEQKTQDAAGPTSQGGADGAAAAGSDAASAAEAAEVAVRLRQVLARAKEIGAITAVIREVAMQTNLLALNAAIEAARTGERGRSFAVIADEVRGLAERTATATVQIERMLGHIQHDTQGAVADVSGAAGKAAEETVVKQREPTGSLREIRAGADLALARIRDLAEASKEQGAAATLAQQVEQIAQMVAGTNASMQSAVGAVEELERLAARLREASGRFRG